jgi:hypothetical protein
MPRSGFSIFSQGVGLSDADWKNPNRVPAYYDSNGEVYIMSDVERVEKKVEQSNNM